MMAIREELRDRLIVMAGLVPAIHVFHWDKTWMPGMKPGMTVIG
jgi:hypothetical protein